MINTVNISNLSYGPYALIDLEEIEDKEYIGPKCEIKLEDRTDMIYNCLFN
ncbi:MAG: hypothetical protein GX987_08175 [Tissierellia bacterium]|nr:hypothetical protein [Tissierellia bacterium]